MANDAVRRIMAEVKEFSTLNCSKTAFFHASPLETDLFEWHFTVRGPPDTAFEHGVYHGRILLPPEYPLKPPEIIMLTPNGRFEVGKRICLSVTAHHQETWQPSWGIRTILTALVGFMPSKADGVGALDYPDSDRAGLARKSVLFHCRRCGARPAEQLPPRAAASAAATQTETDSETQVESVESREEAAETDHDVASREQAATGVETVADDVAAVEGDVGNAAGAEDTEADGSRAAEEDAEEITAVEPAVPREAVEIPASGGERMTEQNGNTGDVQEKELLYVAYAIVFVMLAVVARRVVKLLTE